MTVHRQLPSEVEPAELGELIADCMALPELALPQPRPAAGPSAGRVAAVAEHRQIVIPEAMARLVAGYEDYGS